MLGSKVVRFIPHRIANATDVAAEIAGMMRNANPRFLYQCPTADIEALMAGQVPFEVRLFVDDPHPDYGPQPDKEFITTYRADIFSDVIVSDVFHASPLPRDDGLRFSDYTMISWTDSGIAPVHTQVRNLQPGCDSHEGEDCRSAEC